MFQDYPAASDYFRLSDGKIHALGYISESMHNMRNYGHSSYYMPFARDNNKKVPATLDEMTDYLSWVRDNDVNKNGDKNDEIPLAFRADELNHLVGMAAKAYMPFVFTDDYFGLARNSGGKIVEQYKDPLFRESLKVLNNWYKEKLIYEGSFSMTGDQMNSLVRSPTPVVAIMATAFGKYLAQSNTERWLEVFNAIDPLKGPNGAQYGTITDPWYPFQFGWIITDKCSDPEMIIAVYDYCLTDEMTLLTYYGPKGIGWTDPDPGTTAIRGGPAAYKPLISYGQGPVNSCWSSSHANINNAKGFVQTAAQGSDYDTVKNWYDTGNPSLMSRLLANPSFNETMNYMIASSNDKYKMPTEVFIPPLLMNSGDVARYSDIKASLDAYKMQAFTEFIIGRRNISSDSDWNTYLAELDRLGSSEMVNLIQKYVK
jgi:putative aldouronate transport system substrate-binding protein